jgi:hypothetical protein
MVQLGWRVKGLMLASAVGMMLGGCSSAPALTRSGFLSDYSALKDVDECQRVYTSSRLREYRSFMVDPVEVRWHEDVDSEEIAAYCRRAMTSALEDHGLTVTSTPGPGTARIRIAVTSISEATWWKKVHPASNLAGAGRGGAAMESEVVDSMTGEQLGAVVQSGAGNRFKAFNFSTGSDVKSTIDAWARETGDRIDGQRSAGGLPLF